MTVNDRKQHELFGRAFKQMLSFMESKRVQGDPDFNTLLKPPDSKTVREYLAEDGLNSYDYN
jgi:hypothetical protein